MRKLNKQTKIIKLTEANANATVLPLKRDSPFLRKSTIFIVHHYISFTSRSQMHLKITIIEHSKILLILLLFWKYIDKEYNEKVV